MHYEYMGCILITVRKFSVCQLAYIAEIKGPPTHLQPIYCIQTAIYRFLNFNLKCVRKNLFFFNAKYYELLHLQFPPNCSKLSGLPSLKQLKIKSQLTGQTPFSVSPYSLFSFELLLSVAHSEAAGVQLAQHAGTL